VIILYDTNVILDVILQRAPHYQESAAALAYAEQDAVTGFLAAHTITTLHYILRRHVGQENSLIAIHILLEKLQVAAIGQQEIQFALQAAFTDFEDAVCYAAAYSTQCTCIVTRNTGDFKNSKIPALTPYLFCVEQKIL